MTLAWHTSILAYQTCDNEGQTGMLFADLDWTGVVKKYPECWEKNICGNCGEKIRHTGVMAGQGRGMQVVNYPARRSAGVTCS